MGRIDLAWFNCDKCGHRCTSPDSINIIPHEMEIYRDTIQTFSKEVFSLQEYKDKITSEVDSLKLKHIGNILSYTIDINDKGTTEIDVRTKIKMDRSYAKVLFQSNTELIKSKEITLGCPQCDNKLYEVKFDR